MSTKAVIRAWHNAGSQYIFWGVTQIADPLSEYPSGGGYPAIALLSDFVLLDYEGESVDFSGSIMEGTWAIGVDDGYAVYVDDITGDVTLAQADNYDTSRVIGSAYVNTDYVVVGGEYDMYCEDEVDAGDPVYLSPTTAGAVTGTAPRTATEVQVVVGTATEEKATSHLDTVKVLVDPREPLEIETTIEI